MHSGRPTVGSGHHAKDSPSSSSSSSSGSLSADHAARLPHPHHAAMLSGASSGPATGLSIFRGGSLTHGEPRVLATVGGQYNGAGVTGGALASIGPYSPLCSVHGQSSPLATVSPYTGFFSQYPATASHYSPTSLMASARLPHIESYSAVLASMGTHVQHAGPHGQAPSGGRAAYLPMGQYAHRSLSATTSPGPSSAHSPSSSTTASFALREREREALLHRGERDHHSPPLSHHRSSLSSSDTPPEDKKLLPAPGMLFSSSQRRGSPGGGLLKEVKNEPRDAASSYQKVPSGKEGSLKHRILTSDMGLGGGGGGGGSPASYGHGKSRSHSLTRTDEDCPSSKRPRYAAPSGAASMASSSSPPTDPHVFVTPHAVSQAPPVRYSPQQHAPRKASPHSPSTASSPSSASYLPQQPEVGASPGVEPAGGQPALHYPPHFMKGSIIQLANGDLKRVEDLQTEDFVSSAQVSADLKVDSSTVVRIEVHPEQGTATLGFSVGEHRVQVTVEATLEHPFFVFGQGWSSCSPEHTMQRYHLHCHKLTVGDICISLTHKDVPLKAAEIISQQQQQQQMESSLKLEEESKKLFREHEDPSLKRSPGHRHSVQDHERSQDNSRNGSPAAEKAGGRGENNSAVDLSNVQSNRDFASSSHNQNTDLYVTSQSSAVDGFPSSDTQSSKTRKWSSHESDASSDHAEVAKSSSDTNQ